ncbi:unnamed protein product [Linum trigynum]|uniref:Uncharacterized protein n=1 Tax=Linum trigynum TaxID=586398 RepID=A0AAV2CWH3_9ROSI
MIEFVDDLFKALYKEVETICAPPKIKEFSWSTPSCTEQQHKNDSGVWVCVRMMGASWDSHYGIWPCGDRRRMQVALYLVKEPTNYIRHKVLKKAIANAPRFRAQILDYIEASNKKENKGL